MASTDILIIGAGAAGLMAARLLAKEGKKVVVLEARDRTGGRIHTIYNDKGRIELGAEFIHGDLPVILELLKEAGIKYHAASGDFWQYKDGTFIKEHQQAEGWDELITKMQALEEDTSIADFLNLHFSADNFSALRTEVKRFVSGYDTADPAEASVFALRYEWANEDNGAQHRLNNGYAEMVEYLSAEIADHGGEIKLNTPVRKINWSNSEAKVETNVGEIYKAAKVIIALPLGILQLNEGDNGAIIFNPPISAQQSALQQIGFGAIIKVLLRFKTKFWEHSRDKDLTGAAFFMSTETVPTWWTQYPEHDNLLTGWLGGNPAREFVNASNEELLTLSLASLANIFAIDKDELKGLLIGWHIANWTAVPFTRGSYAYDKVGSDDARDLLNQSVAETVYFAGEYLYHGPAMGTVEAALTSGKLVAEQILSKRILLKF